MKKSTSEKCLVSACLIGLPTRYDNKIKKSDSCFERLRDKHWIPICPEQLGGLPTPRPAAEITGGNGHDVLAGTAKVIDITGEDVTNLFLKGAKAVLTIAKAQDIKQCYLKSKSPSCGVHAVRGVLAALLEENGIDLIEF